MLFFALLCFSEYLKRLLKKKNSDPTTHLTIDWIFTSIVSLGKHFTLSGLFPHPQSEAHSNMRLFTRIGRVERGDGRHPPNGAYSYS